MVVTYALANLKKGTESNHVFLNTTFENSWYGHCIHDCRLYVLSSELFFDCIRWCK